MKGTVLQRPGRWLTWGATAVEVRATLPGDEFLADPDIVSTRAVTIDAPPEAVWPWLVQMGSGRGGAYTYDWIENLFGLDMHSADEILPQFQHLAGGDELPLGKNGPAMRVEVLDPGRTLVFRSVDGAWVWGFHLRPNRAGTRLISRNRIALALRAGPGRATYRLVMEPGSLIMERRMLLGIKQRAEGAS
ncbi:SRPBCC family protein [Micromonospora profundi]|uniref:SRPBCC family protein n=1 Tax=Micromonospora profundi TaxID=1420889 RepID=A0AAJ6L1M9_9ACTN|nr:SRPBCC family protein [Micromonospora profundi]WLS44730.1 SRPBCC family protein [Micromonospora profundi]